MNSRLSLEFGQNYARIPLQKSPHIHNADALEVNWEHVLAPSACSFVLGNPPFAGAKYQTPAQRAQVRRIAALPGDGGTLDYVAAWFIKAGEYVQEGKAAIGFVATNSITQGEQVAQLWPILFQRHHLEITFAHRTFAWGSDARGMAHVHVVILGLCKSGNEPARKRLFSYADLRGEPTESAHTALTPYLFDAGNVGDRHLVVREAARPLDGAPKMISGSQPIDDGNLILNEAERADLLRREPAVERFVRPFVGSTEYRGGPASLYSQTGSVNWIGEH